MPCSSGRFAASLEATTGTAQDQVLELLAGLLLQARGMSNPDLDSYPNPKNSKRVRALPGPTAQREDRRWALPQEFAHLVVSKSLAVRVATNLFFTSR